MPSDRFLRGMNRAHRLLLVVTGGRFGWTLARMKVLELTTTGRKSGLPRPAMLTAPISEGNTLVIVASRGGDDTHPAWFVNLRADPHVLVSFRDGPAIPMLARIVAGKERDKLWSRITRDHANYARYQERTSRLIPVVMLEPAA